MNMETGGFGGDDRRRWLIPALIVAAVAVVLILILLIGRLIGSRGSSTPTATPARTPTRAAIIASPSASRTTALPSTIGGASAAPAPSTAAAPPTPTTAKKFVVVSTQGDTLNMRQNPSKTAEVLKTLQDGTKLEDTGQTQDADGIKWRKVKDPTDNTEGWVANDFVTPAP